MLRVPGKLQTRVILLSTHHFKKHLRWTRQVNFRQHGSASVGLHRQVILIDSKDSLHGFHCLAASKAPDKDPVCFQLQLKLCIRAGSLPSTNQLLYGQKLFRWQINGGVAVPEVSLSYFLQPPVTC